MATEDEDIEITLTTTDPPEGATIKPSAIAEFRRGFIDTMPLWLSVAPFGIAYALAAQRAGLDVTQTLGMSLLVFAGASQLTAAGLFASGVDGVSIVLTTLVINLRHVLFTASLAARLRNLSVSQRAGLALWVTDESYAISVRRVVAGEAGPMLLLGANFSVYFIWQLSTLTGLLLGGIIPNSLAQGLELVFPLSFTVLLLPYLRARPLWAAALTAAALALVAKLLLPGTWYIMVGAIGGTVVGAVLEQQQ
jgi:4-azaleucine resistance transporter AzlC